MPQSLYAILPAVAVAIFVIATFSMVLQKERGSPIAWQVATLFAALFTLWSIHAIANEGLWGFWYEHIRNAWGNQVWFDLLMAIGAAFALLLPRARAVGMRPVPWLIFILCSGSIGLFAMFARCLYLETRTTIA